MKSAIRKNGGYIAGSPPSRGCGLKYRDGGSDGHDARRSPPSQGVWIEMQMGYFSQSSLYRRPPHGGVD